MRKHTADQVISELEQVQSNRQNQEDAADPLGQGSELGIAARSFVLGHEALASHSIPVAAKYRSTLSSKKPDDI